GALVRNGIRLTWKQQITRRVLSPLERRALVQPATKRVIAISELMRRNLAELYGRSEGVDLVYHGTDCATFHPDNRDRWRKAVRAELGILDDRVVALYVGDLKKGTVPAIRAVAKTPGVTLMLLSPSNPAPYRVVAQAEGAAERVLFLPRSKEVQKY